MESKKIVFAGIGGVGGYFGGLFAHHYENNKNVDVHFIARGAHLEKIKKDGLKIIKGDNQLIAKPKSATDSPADIGIADYIIIGTKTYDLKSIAEKLAPCINENTILLPLLNGPNNKKTIQEIYPNNLVLDGCVYIVSRLKQAGEIVNSGNIQSLYFGLDNYENDKLQTLERLFIQAEIDAHYSKNISAVIWEKFIFLSPLATATTALNKNIGELLEHKETTDHLINLIHEVIQIAKAKGVAVSTDLAEKTIAKIRSFPLTITSSMHSDFQLKKQKNELNALTIFVIEEGIRYAINTPTYSKLLKNIKSISQN